MFHFNGSHSEVAVPGPDVHRHTNGTTKPEKRHITRNRTSHSCLTCRRRKVKCNKVRPVCEGCEKSGEECIYSDDAPGVSSQTDVSNIHNEKAWKKRKSYPAEQGSLDILAETAGLQPSIASTDLKAVEDHLAQLTNMVTAMRREKEEKSQFKSLLTPNRPSPDSASDTTAPRSKMSLDMFHNNAHSSNGEANELSTPLSDLRLSNGELKVDDPFWLHVSDEIEQLNHLMRRRDDTYVSTLRPENKQCDVPKESHQPPESNPGPLIYEDWNPTDFHREGGFAVLEAWDLESHCPDCRQMPGSKASLLHGLPTKGPIATATKHLAQGLPTRTQSNAMFRCWLTGVYPIVGLLLPHDLVQKHEEFWDDLEASSIYELKHPNLDFVAALHGIWYAGVLSMTADALDYWFPDTTRARLCAQFHDHAVLCLSLASFPRKTSLYKLGTLVLLQSIPCVEEEPLQSSLYLSLIVRVALTMGLHREPSLFELSEPEAAMRRRLWWQIIQLDISHVVASGYPTQISEKFCDTRVICEDPSESDAELSAGKVSPDGFKETPIHMQGPICHSEAHVPFRTHHLVARGKSIVACALRSVVQILLETKRMTHIDVAEMKRVTSEAEEHVNAIIQSIPARGVPEMGFAPVTADNSAPSSIECDAIFGSPVSMEDATAYTTPESPRALSMTLGGFYRQRQAIYNKWARISLSMLIDKIHCVSYAPFLKNSKSKLWSIGRQCALHYCHSFMRKFISLATDPELEPFRWAWPSLYGPLHAVLIILVDLYERADSIEAARSRELVDQVFALSDASAGIVGGHNGATVQRPFREGGLEAWDMLRGLRSAAWQKVGLDPRVLWNVEDQIRVGATLPLTETQKVAQSLREGAISDGSSMHGTGCSGLESLTRGVKHMVDLNRSDFGNMDEPGMTPGPCFTSGKPSMSGGNVIHQVTSRPLARLDGQKKMPFPLHEFTERCMGTAGDCIKKGAATNQILNVHTHIPQPEPQQQSPSCPGRNDAGQGDSIGSEVNNERWPNGTNQAQSVSHLHMPDQTVINGHVNGHSSKFDSRVMATSVPKEQSKPTISSSQQDTEMDLDFDWDKWDSVFGQYSGFTDLLMDDITPWSQYVDNSKP
jgi:hypothetical protein